MGDQRAIQYLFKWAILNLKTEQKMFHGLGVDGEADFIRIFLENVIDEFLEMVCDLVEQYTVALFLMELKNFERDIFLT